MSVYRDFDLSFRPHPVTGDLVMRNDVAAVLQSVKNLVMSMQNDFIMRPDLYGGANVLFELKSGALLFSIRNSVERTIRKHEPRVELKEVSIVDGNDPNSIKVQLVFYMLNAEQPIVEYLTIKRTR